MNRHKVALIIHNIRSAHNVGSMLRTADGLGVNEVFLTGYTPYPKKNKNDERLPHIQEKLDRQIHKTALGAENTVNWHHHYDINQALQLLRKDGYKIAALEQTPSAIPLNTFKISKDVALIVGSEVDGIAQEALNVADMHIEIPMLGKKESLNVSIAASIALYHMKFYT